MPERYQNSSKGIRNVPPKCFHLFFVVASNVWCSIPVFLVRMSGYKIQGLHKDCYHLCFFSEFCK